MMTFKVHFHRYANGQSRLSSPQFITAEDFADCVRLAYATLSGLKAADMESSFLIASIDTTGLRGEECIGAAMFETETEFSDRVLRGMSDGDVKAEAERLENNSRRSDKEDQRLDRVLEEIGRRNI